MQVYLELYALFNGHLERVKYVHKKVDFFPNSLSVAKVPIREKTLSHFEKLYF